MESALLIFAALARYVMGVLTQYMGTLHGLLQVGACGCTVFVAAACLGLSGCSAATRYMGTLHGLLQVGVRSFGWLV